MPDVICMGEILVEFVATKDNVSLAHSPGFIKAPGGAPANVAVALQKLGLPSRFIGKVGGGGENNDPFGTYLRESLHSFGVDTRYLLTDPEARTTAVFVAIWDDGHKDLCFYRNPGADMMLHEAEITTDLFSGARGFHYGSITFINEPASTAQWKALKMARDAGLMISYDPNYRPTLWPSVEHAKKVIREGFRYCHLAKVSEEEWEIATGCRGMEEGIKAVLDAGVELLVVTRGSRGAMATNGDYRIEVPAFPVDDVVETTGAGDGFMAAMILKLLPERERSGSLSAVRPQVVEDALRFANAVGALACTRPGAIPAFPTLQAVTNFMMGKNRSVQSPSSISIDSFKPSKIVNTTDLTVEQLASMIDHTFLKPYGTPDDIERLCKEARQYDFAMVAVHPAEVETCVRLLEGSGVRTGAAIGFPLGQNTLEVKAFETRDAIAKGAAEIDVVINIRALQAGHLDMVRREITDIVSICREAKAISKVILETCYLADDEKRNVCQIALEAGADFVKTSTSFGTAGATVEDVQLMRASVGPDMGVKAAGGVRTLDDAMAMIGAGATRIGTSSGVQIIEELRRQLG